jgi:hypothetical protein
MTKNLKVVDARDDARAELAAAIADAETARRNLEIARLAFSNSENQVFERRDKLDALRKIETEKVSQDHVLEALAAGSDFDVNELKTSDSEARAREEKAEVDIATWVRARDVAGQAIPDRRLAVERADRKVEIAAHRVICADIDVGRLVAEAEEAAASIVAKRIMLLHIRTLLPDGRGRPQRY